MQMVPGETSIASTISYLDNAFVYVGSSYGDSQMDSRALKDFVNLCRFYIHSLCPSRNGWLYVEYGKSIEASRKEESIKRKEVMKQSNEFKYSEWCGVLKLVNRCTGVGVFDVVEIPAAYQNTIFCGSVFFLILF
ncbi:hypothetical protein L2E82_30751 [Cichorium intybus]|uniref:Uncharacterized protein n=1 Tax=Cichorium intybus TaxID=13427 RepID=A0ACB9D1I8_CICIN|nr:hypothetical protein L2E82_30751 [Cichorium intybus]